MDTAMDPERIAVIIGVGQVNDCPPTPDAGMDALELMVAALHAADRDAGGGWLSALDSLAVVHQVSFPKLNPLPDKIAEAIGASPSQRLQTEHPMGDSPIRLLNDAANSIADGTARIAAVVGGEALRTAAQRAALSARTGVEDQNALRKITDRPKPGYRQGYGLSAPVDIYPLYENAGRAAYGQTLAEGQAETGIVWSGFSEVAAANPHAWLRQRYSAEEIVTPSDSNRPIAFPYTKLMVANSSVNQGAALLVTSLAEARRRGLPEDRFIYIGRGGAAHEADDFLARDRYDRSVSLETVLTRTLGANEVSISEVDLVELYSCFPCVPKMARRAIGWPVDRMATVSGGLTFGGGPLANYMSHAAAAMVEALRAGRGEIGLLFANGGYATHNHAIALFRQLRPFMGKVHDYDLQAEADAARDAAPLLDKSFEGAAVVESYTLFHRRDGSVRNGVIVARTCEGTRTLARLLADDPLIGAIMEGRIEFVGTAGTIARVDDESIWNLGALPPGTQN